MRHLINLDTGARYGHLTVIGLGTPARSGQKRWRLKCDCGNIVNATGYDVIHGKYVSCGCETRRNTIARNTSHGYSKTRLYNVWSGMKQRCNEPHHISYPYYGAIGISVCDEWKDFSSFQKWSLENGYDEMKPRGSCTIDRIDPNGDYCPNNCRWVSMKVQQSNHRTEFRQEVNTYGRK